MWHKTATEIIAKIERGRAALNHQTKDATAHSRLSSGWHDAGDGSTVESA